MITIEDINKPKPIKVDNQLKTFQKGDDVTRTIENLRQGNFILIKTFYSDGISLLADLHKNLKSKLPNDSFSEQQAYRAAYQKLSNRVVVEIVDQKLSPNKSPNIGWLNKFYPDNNHFLLTFPQVQGLNSAWQWHEKGITLPVLRNKLQPYYGTYFPTRFEHLILFDNFLKHYKGSKKSAIDVGVGCGVLSLQMVNHQFQKVFATDINPNAIFGLQEFMGTTKLSRKIELDYAHLFGKWNKETELIVFNPPWLPETRELERIDEAIYYNNNLFDDFFVEAQKRLLPEGQLVIVFSNLAKITNVTTAHPVEKELVNGKRFQLERYFKKQVKPASSKTKRNQYWRDLEEVELWVLKHV
jgi:hypothetical protein